MTRSRRNRFAALRSAGGTAILLGMVIGLGACASTRKGVALRGADDLRADEGRRYVLPDSAESRPVQAWGIFEAESLVIYRPAPAHERHAADGRVRYRREVRLLKGAGVDISGFTRADGRYVRFEGTVRRDGDDLVFEPRPRRGLGAPIPPQRLPAAEIRSVQAYFPSVGNTVLMFSAIGLMALTGVALSIASSMQDSVM